MATTPNLALILSDGPGTNISSSDYNTSFNLIDSLLGKFRQSGGNQITFTSTGITNVTLPTSGTLLSTAGGAIKPSQGGTGIINNDLSTLTISGNFATTITVTNTTSVTLPTSGTLITNSVTTLSSLVSIGTITTGTWSATAIAANKGGTGQTSFAVGDLLSADTTSTLSKVAAVGNGQILISAGTNTLPIWSTSPVVTQITAPTIFGGSGNTSTLIHAASSGAGATTGADQIFKGGASGTTELARILGAGTNQGNITTLSTNDSAGGSPILFNEANVADNQGRITSGGRYSSRAYFTTVYANVAHITSTSSTSPTTYATASPIPASAKWISCLFEFIMNVSATTQFMLVYYINANADEWTVVYLQNAVTGIDYHIRYIFPVPVYSVTSGQPNIRLKTFTASSPTTIDILVSQIGYSLI